MNRQANEDHTAMQAAKQERERQWRIRNAHLFSQGIVKAWPAEDQAAAAAHFASMPSAEEQRAAAIAESQARLERHQARLAQEREDARPYRGVLQRA